MSMAVLLPALAQVRQRARTILNMSHQRQIAGALNLFAADNGDRYPESVATVGFDDDWNWSDPTKLTGNRKRSPRLYRAMSEYLRQYIADASVIYCPSAPREYEYLQEAWDAGDEWDNPETPFPSDPVGGTYCFYWNYTGFLEGRRELFRGPQGPASSGRYSKLVVSDYFGYGHWRSPTAFSSCEKFGGADITPETWLLSPYWSSEGDPNCSRPNVKLQAGFTDEHVESYPASDVVPMKVSLTSDGTVPYPDGVGPGIFYLPTSALH
jgi:hypothetical protein